VLPPKLLDALLPRSLAASLCILVGLLSILPIIIWAHVVRSERDTRELLELSLLDRASTTAQVFSSRAPTEPRTAPQSGPLMGLPDVATAGACKPTSSGASCVTSKLPVSLPDQVAPSLISPREASFAKGLPEASPWSATGLDIAAALYLAVVFASLIVLLGVLRQVKNFNNAVQDVVLGRLGGNQLVLRTTPRELATAARLLDHVMSDLGYTVRQLRGAADDYAHAMRTPLATVSAALHTVRRSVSTSEPRAQRAVEVIEKSVDRLYYLVNAAQRHGQSVAALIAAPRQRLDLADIVRAAIAGASDEATESGISIRPQLQRPIGVLANAETLEIAICEVLLSAVDSSPEGSDIMVTLSSDGTTASLVVEDRGQDGQDETLLFDQEIEPTPGKGGAAARWPGLSSVRRTIESSGGCVAACRNMAGGLSVSLTLPVDR
jgi:His Kinase A (phospho-acceptor) domain